MTARCTVWACDDDAEIKGMCQGHYDRAHRLGDPLAPSPRTRLLAAWETAAEVEWLLGDSTVPPGPERLEVGERIAGRLGMARDSLLRALQRADRLDLYERLVVRCEPPRFGTYRGRGCRDPLAEAS